MKKYTIFLYILAIGCCLHLPSVYANCPDTTVGCALPDGNIGYLFEGQKVPSYWHALTLGCRPLHFSESQLNALCKKTYNCDSSQGCDALYDHG